MRGFFHYMTHLNSPIFISVEYTLSFINEYPKCALKKNILLPYPILDPNVFNGNYLRRNISRTSLLYYSGGEHGDCVEVRKALKKIMQDKSNIHNFIPKIRSAQEHREDGFMASIFCPIPIGDSPSSKRMYDVIHFGCIPVVLSDDLIWAFTIQSNGFIDSNTFSIQIPQNVVQFTAIELLTKYNSSRLLFGILPKSKILLYDLLLNSINKSNYILNNNNKLNPLILILQNIPKIDIIYLQYGLTKIKSYYQYYIPMINITHVPIANHIFPQGGAITLLSNILYNKKINNNNEKINEECIIEKNKKHNYISRYPCERNMNINKRLRYRKRY